jgi:hypothetical protein
VSRNVLSLKHNGPPVKLVSVAERLEAVTTNASSGKSPGTQPEGVKHGVVFAIQIQVLLCYTSVAVQC